MVFMFMIPTLLKGSGPIANQKWLNWPLISIIGIPEVADYGWYTVLTLDSWCLTIYWKPKIWKHHIYHIQSYTVCWLQFFSGKACPPGHSSTAQAQLHGGNVDTEHCVRMATQEADQRQRRGNSGAVFICGWVVVFWGGGVKGLYKGIIKWLDVKIK